MTPLDRFIDERVAVREKATGNIVSLPNKKAFNPFFHEPYPPEKGVKDEPKPIQQTAKPIQKDPFEQPKKSDNEIVFGKEAALQTRSLDIGRYEALTKQKAWLVPALKQEYYALRKTLGIDANA